MRKKIGTPKLTSKSQAHATLNVNAEGDCDLHLVNRLLPSQKNMREILHKRHQSNSIPKPVTGITKLFPNKVANEKAARIYLREGLGIKTGGKPHTTNPSPHFKEKAPSIIQKEFLDLRPKSSKPVNKILSKSEVKDATTLRIKETKPKLAWKKGNEKNPTINHFVHITNIGSAANANFITLQQKVSPLYMRSPAQAATAKSTLMRNYIHSRKASQQLPDSKGIHKKNNASLNISQNFDDISVHPLIQTKQILVSKYAFYSKVGYSGQRYSPFNPEKQNQDSFIVAPKLNGRYSEHLFGVADGHGEYGKEVSTLIKNRLPHLLAENIQKMGITEAFKKAFADTNRQVSTGMPSITFSGSTCCVCLIYGQQLYTANVGDSRAIICSLEKGKIHGKAISRDHKPSEPDEAARIRSTGGRIEPLKDETGEFMGPLRVWQRVQDIPGLAMTRAFGDGAGIPAGVIADPEIFSYPLNENDKFLIIASDGIWEFLSNQEVASIVYPFYLKNSAENAADALVKEAHKHWIQEDESIDDITCVVVFLESVAVN